MSIGSDDFDDYLRVSFYFSFRPRQALIDIKYSLLSSEYARKFNLHSLVIILRTSNTRGTQKIELENVYVGIAIGAHEKVKVC